MKTKTIFLFTGMLLLSMLITLNIMAQQPKFSRPVNPTPEQMVNGPLTGNYTYHVFAAPNKSFGYDIFRNERIIFHQPASSKSTINDKAVLTTKEQADKAAALAIEKIKKGMPPELSREEILRTSAQ
jgi:hypothetical protein